jgi:hypothetical protein
MQRYSVRVSLSWAHMTPTCVRTPHIGLQCRAGKLHVLMIPVDPELTSGAAGLYVNHSLIVMVCCWRTSMLACHCDTSRQPKLCSLDALWRLTCY